MGLSFGLTSGFLCHYWYLFLDKKIPGKSIGVVARKILYDQIFFSPICILACLVAAGLIESSNHQTILKELQDKGTKLYLAEWFVWPPAQFINFYFLPTRFRVIYDNFVSLGYDMYTSHVKHEDLKEDSSEVKTEDSKTCWWKSIKDTKPIWSLNLNFDDGEWCDEKKT